MISFGFCSTSDVITFDQNWYHLYSTSAGGKDLSNDTQLRVIDSMKPEICTKMLRNFHEKVRAKFPMTTHGYSMVKIACLDDAFSKLFELQLSKPSKRSITAAKKTRKGEEGKAKNLQRNKKPQDVYHFDLKVLISAHARAKCRKTQS